MRAFLKHFPKNISAILTISDDVSILSFRYMLRSNPEHSGGRDRPGRLQCAFHGMLEGRQNVCVDMIADKHVKLPQVHLRFFLFPIPCFKRLDFLLFTIRDIFRHLKLEITIAIPASNDETI